MRINVLFIAAITFLVALRFGLLGGDENARVPSRLEIAAQWLVDYYQEAAARPGWQVADVQAEPKAVAVRVHIAERERHALTAAPESLQTAGLGNLCPGLQSPCVGHVQRRPAYPHRRCRRRRRGVFIPHLPTPRGLDGLASFGEEGEQCVGRLIRFLLGEKMAGVDRLAADIVGALAPDSQRIEPFIDQPAPAP